MPSRTRSIDNLNDFVQFRHKIWEDCNKGKKWSSVKIEMKRSFFKIFRSFSSRTNSWNISTPFLNAFSNFFRIKYYGDIEKWEAENEKEIYGNIEPTRIVHRKIFEEELSDLSGTARPLVSENLSDKSRKCYDRNCEDYGYHSRLIHSYREVWFLVASRSSVDERNLSKPFRKLDDDVNDHEGHNRKDKQKWIISNRDILHDMRRGSCEDSCKYYHGCSISNSWFIDNLSEPHKEKSSCGDEKHGRKHCSPKVAHIHNLSSATYKSVKKNDHSVTLRKSERNSRPSGIIVDFFLSLFPLFFQSFELWHNNCQKLHDNNCIDIRSKSHENNGEILKSSSHKRAKESKSLIGSKKILNGKKCCGIYPRNRDTGEKFIEDNDTERNKNLLLHIRWLPYTRNILENHRKKR
ncbi:MAG: hypothetical protein ACD_78C00437G0005 [uncultured bacterium (gcode 4)]|uniref:Uncharacterized protein n=1 Tax=uncultured bacterium (gcode 4) TaxID=1234023 RepID=K1XGG6_9BACT|nr:MAG: hypothetical protein ACD_78C00437G0005 [uncultured bacterium (gcode 4)]